MVCSLYYTAYEGFLASYQVQEVETTLLLPFAEQWAHYMSIFFIRTYLQKVQHTSFIPQEKEDMMVLLQTFLLERALQYFNTEIKNRPDRVIVPLRIIQSILKETNLYKENTTMNVAI